MRDLQKINILQLYLFWKNLSIAMVLLIVLLTVSTWTHSVISLFTAIICAFVIYVRIYANKTSHHPTYMLVGWSLMMSIILYTLIMMALAFMTAWGILDVGQDFNIFNGQRTLSVLILAPVCFFTLLVCYICRRSLHRYIDNHFGVKSDVFMKGKLGVLLNRESRIQVRNLMGLFGVLTAINWIYYIFFYHGGLLSDKDIYIFFWVNFIGLAFYLVYLLVHNYNLDLELKQRGELLTPEEAGSMMSKTYLRYFVICGDRIFVSCDCDDPDYTVHKVLDTPFFVVRAGNMVSETEIRSTIEKETGVKGGELRFFFGFKAAGLSNHTLIRYFYFLDGTPEDYPSLNAEKGEWMTLEQIQRINESRSHSLSAYLLADASRLITIMRTEKLYDERGNRRYKLKSYVPTFRLGDVRNTDIDFQSNQWLDIARLNCDKPFFRLRRLLRNLLGNNIMRVWV